MTRPPLPAAHAGRPESVVGAGTVYRRAPGNWKDLDSLYKVIRQSIREKLLSRLVIASQLLAELKEYSGT